jgi:hypothetical protein
VGGGSRRQCVGYRAARERTRSCGIPDAGPRDAVLVRVLAHAGSDVEGHRYQTRALDIVRSDDKRRARLNCIARLLDVIPYKTLSRKKVKLPRSMKGAYDDVASLQGRRFVPEKY